MSNGKIQNKNIYEENLCKRFLALYNEHFGMNYSFERFGEQGKINEVDCICSDSLGIEITKGFYSEVLNREMTILEKGEKILNQKTNASKIHCGIGNMISSGTLQGPDLTAFSKTKELIESKNLKNYSKLNLNKIFLLIDIESFALTQLKDFESYFSQFIWEEQNFQFNEIWIIDWNGIVRIYPSIIT